MFLVLAALGLRGISMAPGVLAAINPSHAVLFFLHNGGHGFLVLGAVFLVLTGAEALYADMGNFGTRPIRLMWFGLALPALLLNYLGQGAFLIEHPDAKNVLFEMIFHDSRFLYVPFLLLSIMATVIASQAMISGMFSIVYQGITTHVLPLFKVDYTSTEMRSQIYIGFVNWFLLFSVLFIIYEFKERRRVGRSPPRRPPSPSR